MKKWLILLLAILMILPSATLAQQADSVVSITYNGQTHEYTYRSFPKCCGESDTSHDVYFTPVDPEQGAGRISISFPTTAKPGDHYIVRRGESLAWVAFYTSDDKGIHNYVSPSGSLLGNGLISDEDYYEMIVHDMVSERGNVYLDATLRGSFMAGTENFEARIQVSFMLT